MAWNESDSPVDDPLEDLLIGELESFQAQLESGRLVDSSESGTSELPDQLRSDLVRSRRCLQLLHQTALLRNSSVVSSGGFTVSFDSSPSDLLRLPERIGRFAIHELVGRGGFGIVYRATDPVVRREVAVKIPRPEILADRQLLERFRNEGLAVARLDHPNIVTVYECGSDAIVPYLAMTYVPGEHLASWRKWNPQVGFREIARILQQLTSAVRHAHSRGIIHRDLKPGNVLLAAPEPGGEHEDLSFIPKITDFGLAKLRDSTGQSTRTGGMLGSVNYMAPEQASGSAHKIDERTDVYGLGAILYELLTGLAPFPGDNDIQTLNLILRGDPPSVASLRRDVPVDLQIICHKCLESDPDRRYQSAAALADDLERYLDGRPILARPTSAPRLLLKWSRRHPAIAGAVGIAMGATFLLLGISLWFNSRLSESLRVAERERIIARQHELAVRRRAYTSDMRLAQIAWNQADVEQTLRLLDRHRPLDDEPDIRNFAWWYLWRQFHHSSRVIGRHEGGTSSVAVSSDGKLAASGGQDAVIRLWALPAGTLIGELHGHTKGPITALAFSPDNRRLVSSGEEGAVRLWDLESRREIAARLDHQAWVADVKFSPSGDQIASAAADKNIRIWNASNLEPLATLSGHTATVRSLLFHPREPLLVSASEDSTLRFWNLTDKAPDLRIPQGLIAAANPKDWHRTLALQPGGDSFIVGMRLGEIQQYGLAPDNFGKLLAARINPGNPRAVIWPDVGGPIVGLTNNEILMLDELDPLLVSKSLKGHTGEILTLAASGDCGFLLSGAKDGEIRFWSLNDSPRQAVIPPGIVPAQASSAQRSSTFPFDEIKWKASTLIAGVEYSVVRLYSEPGLEILREFPATNEGHQSLSQDGRYLLFCNDPGTFRWIDLASGKTLFESSLPNVPSAFELDPSGKLAAACQGNEVLVFDRERDQKPQIFSHPQKAYHAAFLDSPRGSVQLISCCADGMIRFWDLSTGNLLRQKSLHPIGGVRAVTLSSDQSLIATGGVDRKVRVLRFHDLEELAVFSHADMVAHLSFLEQGTLLATFDGTLNIWDLANQTQVLNFPIPGRGSYFAVAPDGQRIATQSRNRITILDGSPLPSPPAPVSDP